MATIIPIGQPRNDAERSLIALLRDSLPSNYSIIHNFELLVEGEFNEIDIAIISPHAVFFVDAKGTTGSIEAYSGKWFPEGRQPFHSPVSKLRMITRCFKGMLIDADQKMKSVFVDAVVVLTANDAKFVDPDGKDKPSVWHISQCTDYFKNAGKVPDRFSNNIIGFHQAILNRIRGKARAGQNRKRFDVYEVKERLGATDQFEEYRAFNYMTGEKNGLVSLKVYRLDPYAQADDRERKKKRIQIAYSTLCRLPSHSGICAVRDFRPIDENEAEFILVSEEARGNALRRHLVKATLALTYEQKIRIVKDVLSAIVHAHSYGVLHRNINPDTIVVGDDGQTRLVNFDYARDSQERSFTVANEIIEKEDESYMAPEFYTAPSKADEKADVFSFGVVVYELFAGQKPFLTQDDCLSANAKFTSPISVIEPSVMPGFDDWLQRLCASEPSNRPKASEALRDLDRLIKGTEENSSGSGLPSRDENTFTDLAPGTELLKKYRIEKKLGKGGFAVVYKAFDMLADEYRALKIVLRGSSRVERLKQEYQTLMVLGKRQHPNVVTVYDPGFLNDEIPYLPMEFIDGQSLEELKTTGVLSLPDAYKACCDAANGLRHIHELGVYHCDIKPANLVWADNKVVIIDFNVAYHANVEGIDGASKKYLPPEYDLMVEPTSEEMRLRDLYALGITFYECVTGQYPWPDAPRPPKDIDARDPREYEKCRDLSPGLVEILLKSIHPRKNKRFQSAQEFILALEKLKLLRVNPQKDDTTKTITSAKDNGRHIFLEYLQSLYSQNPRTNAGTRGLSDFAQRTYVDTALDTTLRPAILDGTFNLIIITGNAGDGKTAFLQKLEEEMRTRGARITRNKDGNGCKIEFNGKNWLTNYDGSQDEENRTNDNVLLDFFGPYAGTVQTQWKKNDIRIIAINEGRLIDFLDSHQNDFSCLTYDVRKGLQTSTPIGQCAVINLTHRNVTASVNGVKSCIFDRVLKKLVSPKHWEGCTECQLANRCYVHFNVLSFSHPACAVDLIERLRTLYELTIMRNKRHITIRSLRSALAYMIAGEYSCDQIKELYKNGKTYEILQGFYFNSWMRFSDKSNDELLNLLSEIDIGIGVNPRLDRTLSFRSPDEIPGLRKFENRDDIHINLLKQLYSKLPIDGIDEAAVMLHRNYLEIMRRLFFFEQRANRWIEMVPYQSALRFQQILNGKIILDEEKERILNGINKGEGLMHPEPISGQLALSVRQVDKATIKSMRLFPEHSFRLKIDSSAANSPFIEHLPTSIILEYQGDNHETAELPIDLDIYEMLERLNCGYRPTIEEVQGFYQGLAIFKNRLSAATYSKLVLTITGHSFIEVSKKEAGVLEMKLLNG